MEKSRRHRLATLVGAAFCLLGGCGTVNSMLGGNSEKEALAAMEWSYGKEAISVELQADPKLNVYEGVPHTLVLGIAQFAEPNQFKALLADPGAVAKLLESGRGVPGVLAFERYIVEPGRSRTLNLDRAQMAQYYGVVAGYYELDPMQNGRLFRIPIDIKSSGLISRTRTAQPAQQRIRLVLGPEKILAAEQIGDGEQQAAVPLDAPPRKGQDSGVIKVDADTIMKSVDLVNAARRLAQ